MIKKTQCHLKLCWYLASVALTEIYDNDTNSCTPEDAVDEELSYWSE
jgi:hypothetical protein